MPETLLAGYSTNLVNLTTVAASTTQTFTMPQADSLAFVADVGTITGTSPTFDIAIQISPDNGTTWYDWWRFAQITAAGVRRLVVQPLQGRGEAGTETAIGTAGTGGALNANAPTIATARVKITAGGTSPSAATLKVWVVSQIRQSTV